MFLFQKGQTINDRYMVVFPHKGGAYAETYRVKDSSGAHNNATMAGAVNEFLTQFSRYLHEMWRTWRVLKQVAESPSSDGRILNLEYNQMRYRCLNTILQQIIKNPKDIYAINDFFFLATYNNITRYSEYMFGNSALLEHMMLFPEILEDTDEGNEDDGETDG